MKNILLVCLSLLLLVSLSGCVSQYDTGVRTLSGYQRNYYESQAAEEYRTFVAGPFENNTLITNESATFTYNTNTALSYDDVFSIVVYDNGDGSTVVASGNYSVNYQTGNINLTSYNQDAKTN